MERRRYTEMLRIAKLTARNWTSDASAIAASRKLETILDELDSLKNVRTDVGLSRPR